MSKQPLISKYFASKSRSETLPKERMVHEDKSMAKEKVDQYKDNHHLMASRSCSNPHTYHESFDITTNNEVRKDSSLIEMENQKKQPCQASFNAKDQGHLHLSAISTKPKKEFIFSNSPNRNDQDSTLIKSTLLPIRKNRSRRLLESNEKEPTQDMDIQYQLSNLSPASIHFHLDQNEDQNEITCNKVTKKRRLVQNMVDEVNFDLDSSSQKFNLQVERPVPNAENTKPFSKDMDPSTFPIPSDFDLPSSLISPKSNRILQSLLSLCHHYEPDRHNMIVKKVIDQVHVEFENQEKRRLQQSLPSLIDEDGINDDEENNNLSDDMEHGGSYDDDLKSHHHRPHHHSSHGKDKSTVYTPLEQQYLDIKSNYPDTILFVESGYRYKILDHDAEIASKVLHIRLGWSHHFLATSIPTHRLHVHALKLVKSGYKVGVVSQTETAALKALSSNKSGPFSRALTAIYTKSTLVDASMDPLDQKHAKSSNTNDPNNTKVIAHEYLALMAISETIQVENINQDQHGSNDDSFSSTSLLLDNIESNCLDESDYVKISIASVCPSTGEIVYDTFSDGPSRHQLETRLLHVRPIEILVPTSANVSYPLADLDDNKICLSSLTLKRLEMITGLEGGRERDHVARMAYFPHSIMTESQTHLLFQTCISKASSVEKLMALGSQLKYTFGGLIYYLKEFGLAPLFDLDGEWISFSNTVDRINPANIDAGSCQVSSVPMWMQLDGNALSHLELLQNQHDHTIRGSLLSVMDYTKTAFGRRLLISWIQKPLYRKEDIEARLEAVSWLKSIRMSTGISRHHHPSQFDSTSQDQYAHREGVGENRYPHLSENSSNPIVSSMEDPLSSIHHLPMTLHSSIGFIQSLILLLPTFPDLERGICRIYCQRIKVPEFILVLRCFSQIADHTSTWLAQESNLSQLKLKSPLLYDTITLIPSQLKEYVDEFLSVLNLDAKTEIDFCADENAFPDLADYKNQIQAIEQDLDRELERIRLVCHHPRLQYVTKVKEEYLIELPLLPSGGESQKFAHLPSMEVPLSESWIRFAGTKKISRYRSPIAHQLYQQLMQVRERWEAETKKSWSMFVRQFIPKYPIFRNTIKALSILDALQSLAQLAQIPGYIKPIILDTSIEINGKQIDPNLRRSEITIVDGRHPIVESLISSTRSFVPNDTFLSSFYHSTVKSTKPNDPKDKDLLGEPNHLLGSPSEKSIKQYHHLNDVNNDQHSPCILITGPNMGGKTCYIKQVALICLMAQIGSFVPAQEARLTPLDAIFVRMGAYDQMLKGQSTFLVELQETATILNRATWRSLAMIDELGRGTSTYDGMALAYAVLEYLMIKVQCLTLFVTHYPEISKLSRIYPNHVRNYHISYLQEEKSSIQIGGKNQGLMDTTQQSHEFKISSQFDHLQMDQQGFIITAGYPTTTTTAIAVATIPQIHIFHKLVPGIEHASFGLNVARMANCPESVVKQAAQRSLHLESQVRKRLAERQIQLLYGIASMAKENHQMMLKEEGHEIMFNLRKNISDMKKQIEINQV